MDNTLLYKPKTYFVQTFGCQANKADSSTIAGVLEALGFEETNSPEASDLYVINTCSVRQKSEDKVYGIGKMLKGMKSPPFVVMAGCMVGSVTGERQRYAFAELKKRTPWVGVYINPSQIMSIPEILHKNGLIGEWAAKKFDPANVVSKQENNVHAFVNISYGCDNFCTFCVVPYARGKEVSRAKEEILGEINHLVGRGFKHVTLCGQNVNSWGLSMSEKFDIRTGSSQKLPFATLLREVHKIAGIEKIDFISSNPFDFTNDLIDAITSPKISNYLHIAAQSGNNDVLKRMNRRHTVQEFMELITAIKRAKPQVELGTDVIVGFPGETHEQFMDTVGLFEAVGFNVAFISMYSPRKGTPAQAHFNDDVSLEEKKWRHAHLTEIWEKTRPKSA